MDSSAALFADSETLNEIRNRTARMAKSSLRRWGVRFEDDEIQSAADLAICEAAKRYDSKKGAAFSSFVYFYLKGILIGQIRTIVQQRSNEIIDGSLSAPLEIEPGAVLRNEPASSEMGPDEACHRSFVRAKVSSALSKLSSSERSVLCMSDILEVPMTEVAISLGYSRGHLHEIRRRARKNIVVLLRSAFASDDDVKWAA